MDPECNPLPAENPVVSAYQLRSALLVAVHPIGREPWCLGIHHCREARVYGAEVALLEAIGRRIGEALSRLLDVQALERSKQRFGVLLEHAPEAIVILDVERGRFVEFNGNAERLFGWSSAELLTKGPEELSPEFQPSGELSSVAARREIERAVAGEHPVFEWMHMDARGRHVPCEVRLVLLPDPERLVLRGSVTDISQRKASEQRQQVLESQLLQAQKMEALGQLTGGVAHDFNNILTVILGNSELALAQLGAQHSTAPLLAEALKATRKGATLTQRLLAFSRKQALVPRAVAVDALVRGMEEMLVRTLGESIRIETVMGAGLWDCEADPSQLENAILNLAINARDAMPDGGRLTIEASNTRLDTDYSDAHSDVPPGQYVLLAISDDGEGMSGEVMAQAFEPFFTTKDVGRGSGLGLSMVFGFAKQSRGHLKLYSEPGQGTTVKLYLPRSLDAAESSRATDEGRGEPRGSGQWILVVEDEPAVREYLTRALEELGYRTHQAGDAAAAVTLLESPLHVDLLLTDVVLPGGVNGAELARSAAGLRPDLRVLFISGYSENAIIHHGRLDPGVELLCKPFAKAKLARSVRDVLAR